MHGILKVWTEARRRRGRGIYARYRRTGRQPGRASVSLLFTCTGYTREFQYRHELTSPLVFAHACPMHSATIQFRVVIVIQACAIRAPVEETRYTSGYE